MPDRRHQVQVGVLFLLSVVVLVGGILWFKEFTVGGATYEIVGEFPTASGLMKGDAVEVRGVPSGKVAEIRFDEGKANVIMQIDREVLLYPGTRVTIDNVGLMGQKIVSIVPGPPEGEPLPPGAHLAGRYRAGIPELMVGLGGTLHTFERLATRVDSLIIRFDQSKQDQMEQTLGNVEQLTGELAALLTDNRADLTTSIRGLAAITEELHAALDGRGEQVGLVLDRTTEAASRLDSTLTSLDHTVGRLDALLSRVEGGEGSLGRALRDDTLYDQLVGTLRQTRALLRDLQENPGRYFTVDVF